VLQQARRASAGGGAAGCSGRQGPCRQLGVSSVALLAAALRANPSSSRPPPPQHVAFFDSDQVREGVLGERWAWESLKPRWAPPGPSRPLELSRRRSLSKPLQPPSSRAGRGHLAVGHLLRLPPHWVRRAGKGAACWRLRGVPHQTLEGSLRSLTPPPRAPCRTQVQPRHLAPCGALHPRVVLLREAAAGAGRRGERAAGGAARGAGCRGGETAGRAVAAARCGGYQRCLLRPARRMWMRACC
jgi:hypothetical protein